MARTLTTPVDTPDVGYQAIESIRFNIPHTWDGNDIVLVKDSISVTMTIANYDVTGQLINRHNQILYFPSWPAAFITETNTLYSMIENWAETQGIILGEGSTESI